MEKSERESLIKELEAGTRKLEELSKDLEWREADLELERGRLKELAARGDEEMLKLIGAQIVVVETIERVLENERREYEELKAKLEETAKTLGG